MWRRSPARRSPASEGCRCVAAASQPLAWFLRTSARSALIVLLLLLLLAASLLSSLPHEGAQAESELQFALPGNLVVGAQELTAQGLAQEHAALESERAALQSERAALQIERAALQSERAALAKRESPEQQAAENPAQLGAEPPCWNATLFRAFSNVTLSEEPSNRVCRRAVTFRGSDVLLYSFAQKVSQRMCTHTVLFGGSISCGSGLGRKDSDRKDRDRVFLAALIEWLNAHYPCSGKLDANEQSRHSFINLCRRATTIAEAYGALMLDENRDALQRADLIIVEKTVNDVEFGYAGGLDRKGRVKNRYMCQAESYRAKVLFWVELFLRRARSHFPRAGLLFLEASSVATWSETAPFRLDASAQHLEALEFYDVPQLDMLRMLGPNSFSDKQRFLEEVFLDSSKIHPTVAGHALIAAALAQFLSDLTRDFAAQRGRPSSWLLVPPRDRRLPDRGGLVLSQRDIGLAEADSVAQLRLLDKKTLERVIVAADPGWGFRTDSTERPNAWMTETKNSCTVLRAGKVQPSFFMVDLWGSSKEVNFSAAHITAFQRDDCSGSGDDDNENTNIKLSKPSKLEALPTVEQWMRGSGTRKVAAALVVTWMYDDRDAETKKTATTQLFSAFLHAERDATLLPLCEMYVKVCEATYSDATWSSDRITRAERANRVKFSGITLLAPSNETSSSSGRGE